MAALPEIDGYSDLVRVAKGGFGIVYRAKQDRHDRVVALKVLTVDDLDDRGQQRFERECRAMGSLSWHPNVVALLDSGITADGHPFLAMEYLEGGSFGDRLRNGPLTWEEAVVAGVQVAGALDVAHAAGILHRDLKPENILVGPYNEAKLGDFGIAAVENAARTTTGHASFTVDHVSPEVLRGQRPDERSDLYGLASTLHTLISGSSPFAGDPDAPIATQMMRVLEAPTPRLHDVPDDLADLLERTLARDPADRPASAEDLGRHLQEIQKKNGQVVTDLRLSPAATTTSQPADRPLASENPDPEPNRRDPQPTIQSTEAHRPGDPAPTVIVSVSADQEDTEQLPRSTGVDARAATASIVDEKPHVDVPGSKPGRTPSGRLLLIGGTAVALLLVIGAVIFNSGPGDSPASSATSVGNTPVTSSPPSITETIALETPAENLAVSDGSVYLTSQLEGTLQTVDISTGDTEVISDVGDDPVAVTVGGGAIWVTNFGGTVSRIDPETQEVTATIEARAVGAPVFDDGTLWVTSPPQRGITAIDADTNDVRLVDTGAVNPELTIADGTLFATNDLDTEVNPIDLADESAEEPIPVGSEPASITNGFGSLWVTDTFDNTLTRIDISTREVTATIDVGPTPIGVASGEGAIWVVNSQDSTLSRVDPETNEVTATLELPGSFDSVAVGSGFVWVPGEAGLLKIDPGTVT